MAQVLEGRQLLSIAGAEPTSASRRAVPLAHQEPGLVARAREVAHVDILLERARAGRSGALVLLGEPGAGKSVLIEAAAARAGDFFSMQLCGRTGSGTGLVALRGSLPSALHELAACVEGEDASERRFTSLAPPSQSRVALPRHLVETAVSALCRLLDRADSPFLLTVDDCDALPASFVTALAGAVSELADAPLALVFATRLTPHLVPFDLPFAPGPSPVSVHRLAGFSLAEARELARTRRLDAPLSDGVLATLVARTQGNPRVLIDLWSHLTPDQLGGWHLLPDPLPLEPEVAEAFDVTSPFPARTRKALVVLAGGMVPSDVREAAMRELGVSDHDLAPAIAAGVVSAFGPSVAFEHPLVRKAVFSRAPKELRQAVRGAMSSAAASARSPDVWAAPLADEVVPSRRAASWFTEGARAALAYGDPAQAARCDEQAARMAPGSDAFGLHQAAASGHWLAAGERGRARHCIDAAADLAVSAPVAAELAYRSAALDDRAPDAANCMAAAAQACRQERPQRALAMLTEAASLRLLAGHAVEAAALAAQAVDLAGAVSRHSELLARAVHQAASSEASGAADADNARESVSILGAYDLGLGLSAEVALVVGCSLVRQDHRSEALRWSTWMERVAQRTGFVTLDPVKSLLEASSLLVEGRPMEAARAASVGAGASRSCSATLECWAWQLAATAHGFAGQVEEGYAAAARTLESGCRAGLSTHLRLLPALALLELRRANDGAALALARVAENELFVSRGSSPSNSPGDAVPLLACVLFLAGGPLDAERWKSLLDGPECASELRELLRGVSADYPLGGAAALATATAAFADRPLLQSLVEVCWAKQLVASGKPREAAMRLSEVERRATQAGAGGLTALATRELAALSPGSSHLSQGPSAGRSSAAASPAGGSTEVELPTVYATSRTASQQSGTAAAESSPASGRTHAARWAVTLLGGFSVLRDGVPVALPESLAAQTVKIVALRSQVTVDELVEMLWEGAEPGVGARRVRNVLWRVRTSCPDLVVREGTWLRLAPDATSDLHTFQDLAHKALMGPSPAQTTSSELARAAVELYRGDLLPGDRYADWATTARESAARTYVQLLDLLVDDALEHHREAEALVLLDRLSRVDPFDERHHVRAAEIHLAAGNRGRALEELQRSQNVLADLGVAASPAIVRLREDLGRT